MPEIRTCPVCGVEFKARPSQRKTCCCSMQRRAAPLRGKNHPNHKGGLCFSGGRWHVVPREGGVIAFSRVLMEGALRRHLLSTEIVHHINEDPTDDRLDNLQILTRGEHLKVHRAGFEERRLERLREAQWTRSAA